MGRNLKKEKTNIRITEAALQLFRHKGFDQTTVKEITEKAHVAKGTFFNYFPTKESVLQALAQERLKQAIDIMQQADMKQLSLHFQIKAYVNKLLDDYDMNPAFTLQLWTHVLQVEETIRTHWSVLLTRAKQNQEIAEHVDIETWSHILNSHFYYALSTYSNETSKQNFLNKVMPLIHGSIQGISEKRGNQLMQKIVILGGGYGGMRMLQRLLTNELPSDVHITLIDKMPHHCLKTEYYALAAGTEADQHLRVTFPEDPRLEIKYGTVTSIELAEKSVYLEDDDLVRYDTLIIGLGCEDKYHNVPGAPENTLSIQSMEATRKTYQQLNNIQPQGVVSIVGAGLSGVEIASELRESRPDLTIKLFDRGDIILSMFPYRLSSYVQKWFINHGVDVINKSNITKVEKNALYNHDERIDCDAIIWTAGIQPVKVVHELDIEKDGQGRVVLTPHHHLPTDKNVFVVGDCASLPHAPSAQLAEGQAEQIVTVLRKRWKNEPLPEQFPQIKLKGVLGSLGKKHGFGVMGERTLLGRVPRVLKSGVLWMYKHHSG